MFLRLVSLTPVIIVFIVRLNCHKNVPQEIYNRMWSLNYRPSTVSTEKVYYVNVTLSNVIISSLLKERPHFKSGTG